MRVRTTVVQEGAAPQDAMISADEGVTAAEVAEALERARRGPALPPALARNAEVHHLRSARTVPATLWVDGQPLSPETQVGDILRDGARITVDDAIGPFLAVGEPTGRYEVRVCGGPGAGRVARLSTGVATLGSADTCTVTADDPRLASVAARVTVDIKGRVDITPQGDAELFLDDEPVTDVREWEPGMLLKAGDSLFSLAEPGEPDAHLSPTGEGGLAYNRPPRLSSPLSRPRLTVPMPPGKDEGIRFQLISMLMPLFFGVAMYFVTKTIYMLLFCLLSPLMMLGQWFSDRRHGKKKYRAALKEYKKAKEEQEAELERLAERDQRRRREAFPDPGQLLLFATGPRRRLWERRITDPDAMFLRVGFSDLKAEIDLVNGRATGVDAEDPEPPVVTDVPMTLPFAELGVVGIAGDRPRAVTTARWMTAQAAVLHSPRDLSLVVLSSVPDAAENWSWTQWLPHANPQQGQNCVALLGTDAESISRRVNELLNELARRQAAARESGGLRALRPDPHVLVVLDGARLLRRVPGVPQLLQEGPGHGIFALCVDEDERLLPEECRTAVCWSPGASSTVHLRGYGYESVGDVLADQVSVAWCERVARAMAPVRDVSRDDADSALPTSARLLSLLRMPDPTGADIAAIWKRGGATTAAFIGMAADGPFVLDIRRDGPHALIAGTTGAGKSELLQTIIASLAVGNTPDALNFVLIDYKGGSAFQDCARLPHTVGMVSDLDAHLTERALASLAAELRRREGILFEAATKDIEDYNDARRLRPELEPMPRLVLIIDEFASLVAELPDFIAGLVDIARRGRSLGVHLMLATQRPAGVVSADIRANTNLRIALRVTNGEESRDVIDAPDAGNISKSTPGRCYVRSGSQSLVGVQSARIGGRRPGTDTAPQVTVNFLDWMAYGRPLPRVAQDDEDDGTMVTDLAVLVDAIADGASQLGCAQPRSPWLPPIPTQVTLADLESLPVRRTGDDPVAPVRIGLTDLPAQQAREPLALDLTDGEHLMIAGGPRSGRSTALRTIAGAIARTTSPSDVHLYGIDCGANALLPLASLSHCGAVVTRDQKARVDRLLGRLLSEVSRRQMLLAEKGQSSAAEQRSAADPSERLPWMVVLLDGWDAYRQAFENYDYGRLIDDAKRLFREGAAVGVKVVLTTDRSGLTGDISSSFSERLVLRLADQADYALAGLSSKDVPKDIPTGRALKATDDGVQESQLALLAENPSGQAQVAALQEIARSAGQAESRPTEYQRPIRVDVLPARIGVREAMALQPGFAPASPLWALVAVGGDELQPLGVDLEEGGPGFVISGPPKSGRSSTLVTAATSLLRQGTEVIVITPRRSPLRELATAPGVLGSLDSESSEDDLEALISTARGPYVIVVDDAELLYDTPLDEALEEVVKRGMDGGLGLIAAGAVDTLSSQYRGFVVQARRSRTGLLLSPQGTQDGEMFSIRLPSNVGGGPTGRGLFVQGGEVMPAQAVLPD
ncbi:FtsK/SpoIIIE domain-containing protein [Streptomyces cellulosae]|uniref:FtsK/SpoIIIE domain-containing protein n=1 Tax=Streptomyces cellulosae TaxID=1968 RepID=UPI00224DB326|nr:FtsK/SpoIIIE domain-containing protein [Streptomyces cellulosae]WTB82445.1 FtsK/SpoIIIE domain-containing protein [Streptomyces cellulosae]WTC56603.1 FtsK/SpoIIIE domain-containing protein [Streptomyces cellulosae]